MQREHSMFTLLFFKLPEFQLKLLIQTPRKFGNKHARHSPSHFIGYLLLN